MAKNEIYVRILVSVAFVGSVMAAGILLTTPGLTAWYQTLTLPSYAPPGAIIGAVWTTLYALLATSMVIAWNAMGKKFIKELAPLYLVNGVLNVMWSGIFFGLHDLSGAAIAAAILTFSTAILAIANLKAAKTAALLLIPYVLWTAFATGLNTHIAILNVPKEAPATLPLPDDRDDVVSKPEAITLTLTTGAKKNIDGHLSLTLEVVNDSRCPADEGVQCIWAGELSPQLKAELGGTTTDVRLGTTTAPEADVAGYHLKLLDAGLETAKIKVTLP